MIIFLLHPKKGGIVLEKIIFLKIVILDTRKKRFC